MRSGADGVMVGHCLYLPVQTDDLPASLSREIVGSMLRQRLRCESLVLTDSLDMQAVTKHVDAHRAGLLALEAGCDILLYTEYSERFEESFEAVLEAFLMGRLSDERLADSTKRREKLIERLRFARPARPPYQEEEYLELLERVRQRSVAISDPGGVLPLSCEEAVVVSTSTAVTESLKDHVPSIKRGSDVSDASDRTLILWIMEPLRPGVPFKKVQTLLESAAQSILITTYDPLIERLPGCSVTIRSDDTSPHTVDAIIRRLFEG
jgi:beta-glucosidase-like glycosyl hydrolase